MKEDLIRSLSVPWARPTAAPALVEAFLQEEKSSGIDIKWAIGNALSVVADDAILDALVDILRERGHGRAREMVAVALGNTSSPTAVDVLIEMTEDEEVAGHAIIALGKLKAVRARSYIEPFLTHPKSWVRQEAKRAIAKIDKSRQGT